MAIRGQKRTISFLSGHSTYLVLRERVRGEGGGAQGRARKVLGLIFNFPHSVTVSQNLSRNIWVTCLGISRATMSVKDVEQKLRLPYTFRGVSHPSNVARPA